MEKPPLGIDATLPVDDLGFARTVDAPPLSTRLGMGPVDLTNALGPLSATRTAPVCVLPRVQGHVDEPRLVLEERVRYTPIRVLGSGSMGQVSLVEDHDIGRKVAVKNLHAEVRSAPALARFVEEIRTIGRLEHPNIVPIHDVGVNESGDYFFVMKHVDGETLESIIEKLAAGDRAYHERYTTEVRIEIMIGVLRALQFAHDAGIVHRDVKPANVMIGAYGEVVLMDWGIAKAIGDRRQEKWRADAPANAGGERARLYSTLRGSLVGTPAYMSPEQARGDIDAIDARSDVYSAMVLFHELMSLRHYLSGKETVEAMLVAILRETPPVGRFSFNLNPHQPPPPGELTHMFAKGLQKDPEKRYQSAAALEQELQRVLTGEIRVQCPITLTKRAAREAGRVVDRYPYFAMAAFYTTAMLVLLGIAQTVWMIVR